MPNIKSQVKRVKTNEKRRQFNASYKASMRTAIKKYETALAEGADNSEALLQDAIKAIDSVASKGLIHANKAARDKSRLAKKMSK